MIVLWGSVNLLKWHFISRESNDEDMDTATTQNINLIIIDSNYIKIKQGFTLL